MVYSKNHPLKMMKLVGYKNVIYTRCKCTQQKSVVSMLVSSFVSFTMFLFLSVGIVKRIQHPIT